MILAKLDSARRERFRDEPSEVRALALEATVRTVSEVLQGKEDVVRLSLIAFLARGHLLLEDVPGVGKTTLARALARAVGGSFSRIQLTSDLLPADILGGQVLGKQSGELEFRKGPIFANVVLADELNRATPRTQSGLLEAMAERSVSVDGRSYQLPDPFMVIATQNPLEHHGVYPLPESQLDRFLLRMSIGYPGDEVERALLMGRNASTAHGDLGTIEPSLNTEMVAQLQDAVDAVTLSEDVAAYLQAIVRATRSSPDIETGVSTRGVLSYAKAARARAISYGRTFVNPDDVRELAVVACAHRVVLRGARTASRVEAEAIVRAIVDGVPVPV